MPKIFKYIEYIWLAMAAICLWRLAESFQKGGEDLWLYGALALMAGVMFFVRRYQRRRFEQRYQQKGD